jgi:hypothetical protein
LFLAIFGSFTNYSTPAIKIYRLFKKELYNGIPNVAVKVTLNCNYPR